MNKKEKEIENLETFLLSLNDSLEHEFTFDQQLAILQVSFSQFFKLYINIIYRIETTQALLFVLQVRFFFNLEINFFSVGLGVYLSSTYTFK